MEEVDDAYLLSYIKNVDFYENNEGYTDTEEKGNINNKKNKILHTVYSKLKIIEYDKLTTRKEAFKKLQVAEQTLGDWFKNETKFLMKNKNKTTVYKGGKLSNPKEEKI